MLKDQYIGDYATYQINLHHTPNNFTQYFLFSIKFISVFLWWREKPTTKSINAQKTSQRNFAQKIIDFMACVWESDAHSLIFFYVVTQFWKSYISENPFSFIISLSFDLACTSQLNPYPKQHHEYFHFSYCFNNCSCIVPCWITSTKVQKNKHFYQKWKIIKIFASEKIIK